MKIMLPCRLRIPRRRSMVNRRRWGPRKEERWWRCFRRRMRRLSGQWSRVQLHLTAWSRRSGTAGGRLGSGGRRWRGWRGGHWTGCRWRGSTTSRCWGSAARCRWGTWRSRWGWPGRCYSTGGRTRSPWRPRRGAWSPAPTGAARPSTHPAAPPARCWGTAWPALPSSGSSPPGGRLSWSSSWRSPTTSTPSLSFSTGATSVTSHVFYFIFSPQKILFLKKLIN